MPLAGTVRKHLTLIAEGLLSAPPGPTELWAQQQVPRGLEQDFVLGEGRGVPWRAVARAAWTPPSWPCAL